MKYIWVRWSEGVTNIRSEPETGSEDSLTEYERIINDLYKEVNDLTNAPYCSYCGVKKEHIVYTDANSRKICKNPFCEGNELHLIK